MLAAVHWGTIATIAVSSIAILGALVAVVAWIKRQLVQPLRAVTGSPAASGLPAIPSMFERMTEVQTDVRDHLNQVQTDIRESRGLTQQTHDAIEGLRVSQNEIVRRIVRVEQDVSRAESKIDLHLIGHGAELKHISARPGEQS